MCYPKTYMECKPSMVFDNHLGFDRCVTIYTSTVYAFGGYVKTTIILLVTYAPRGSLGFTLCVRFNIYALRFLTDDEYQTWSLFYNHRLIAYSARGAV